ncbi:Bug family tripartite tricarboxylate transporter substrate binding protein [Bradyrhizobium sp. RDT10]
MEAGKLRVLAIGSPQRSARLPNIPTLQELGLSGFDADAVFGIYAPAGTSPEIVGRLNQEINRLLRSTAFQERIAVDFVERCKRVDGVLPLAIPNATSTATIESLQLADSVHALNSYFDKLSGVQPATSSIGLRPKRSQHRISKCGAN